MSQGFESEQRFTSPERSQEIRETKESSELDEEAKIAAAKERAEFLVKEVQNNTKHMQNIVVHMGQVQQAIKALRQQLQLEESTDTISSISHDANALERLKEKIATYKEELLDMKDDLFVLQVQEIGAEHPEWSLELVKEHAADRVANMLEILQDS